MGKRGPKKEPTVLKLIKGNPGRRPINKREPKPNLGLPKCPAHLNEVAKLEWRRVSRELSSVGLLTKLDRASLAAYCQAWGRWVDAEVNLKKLGSPLFKTPSGYIQQSPYLSIANRALRQMKEFGASLGLSPADRGGIQVWDDKKPYDDGILD